PRRRGSRCRPRGRGSRRARIDRAGRPGGPSRRRNEAGRRANRREARGRPGPGRAAKRSDYLPKRRGAACSAGTNNLRFKGLGGDESPQRRTPLFRITRQEGTSQTRMELVYSDSRERQALAEMPDRDLAVRARGGDLLSFEALVLRKTPVVISLARRI